MPERGNRPASGIRPRRAWPAVDRARDVQRPAAAGTSRGRSGRCPVATSVRERTTWPASATRNPTPIITTNGVGFAPNSGLGSYKNAARAGAPTARFLSFAVHGRLTARPSTTSPRACAPSATSPASRPRSSPSSPPSSASRSSSRARRASARPSSPRRSRRYLERRLVRLQCYEGLDEAKALYEWNYRKQLLRIQAEAEGAGWQEVQDDIFGEEFLLERPLMSAIASERAGRPADRRDRQDRPGVRGDAARAALGLPDLDPRARPVRGAHPADRAADLEQHARAHRGAQAPLPVPLARLPGSSSTSSRSSSSTPPTSTTRSPASSSRSSRWSASSTSRSRRRSRSRSTGRGRCCCSAPTTSTTRRSPQTLSIIVKHRTDLDVVAERVGHEAPGPCRVRRPAVGPRSTARPRRSDAPPGLAAHLLAVRRGAARRGRRGRHERAARRLRGPARGAVDRAAGLPRGRWRRRWPSRRRTAASSTSSSTASSSARPSCAAVREGDRARAAGSTRPAPSSNLETLRQEIARGAARGRRGPDARPRPPGDRRLRPPGRGLGRHRRRRPAHPPLARPARRAPARPAARRPAPRRPPPRRDPPLRGAAAPGARARADRAHRVAAAGAARSTSSTARCRPGRCRTSPPSTASSPSSSAA